MPSLTAATPAEPHADAEGPDRGRRRGRPRRDPRPVAPDPRRPGDRVRGAPRRGRGRRGPRPARVRRRVPGRQPGHRDPRRPAAAGAAATGRGSGSSPSTTRSPGSGTAAATTRWRPPASARRSPSRRWPTSSPARSSSSGRPAEERGSGKQIMIDDGLIDGLDAALMYHPCDRNHVESWPLASEDVDVVFHGPPGARLVGPVEGPQRAGRDDPAVQLGRAVAPAAASHGPRPRDHPRGRHRREHHPGADHAPGS